MANVSQNSGTAIPKPEKPAARNIVKHKLAGILIGAFAGMLVGWFVGHYGYPWQHGHYHLMAGTLAGAVTCGMLAGKTFGRLGWAIVLGTGGGMIVGGLVSDFKTRLELEGAWGGFLAGLVVGLILEAYHNHTTKRFHPSNQPSNDVLKSPANHKED